MGEDPDGSEQRERERSLRLSDMRLRRAREDLASGAVAHDIKNALAVVLCYADAILQRLDLDHPVRIDVEEMQRAAERATSLTRQLLTLAREQLVRARTLDLNQVLGAIERMLRCVLGDRCQLSLVTSAEMAEVHADASQVERVILNLVMNARDAMPDGGAVTIETANVFLDDDYTAHHPGVAAGPYGLLGVTDTGTGMDALTRERIVEPFFTTKEPGKGTGLGLGAVCAIVEEAGGHVCVRSQPGRGTTFNVYLPRTDQCAQRPGGAPPGGGSPATRPGESR